MPPYDIFNHFDRPTRSGVLNAVISKAKKIHVTVSEYKDLIKGLLGTYAFAKGLAVYATRWCGVVRNIINGRGGWRMKRQAGIYIHIWFPHSGALISRKMYHPESPCQYKLRRSKIKLYIFFYLSLV